MQQDKAKIYAKVMVETFGEATGEETKQKVRLLRRILHKRGDAKHIGLILREFARAWKERKGPIATVVAAEPLSQKTKGEMAKQLEKRGYILEQRIDPAVIGGTALYLGNEYMIDATMKGKLERLAKNFAF